MIDLKDLHIGLQIAKPLFNELQDRYETLPATSCKCDKPGICCAYLPQMTLIEALQWFDIISRLPEPEKVDTIRHFMRFYLTNPVHHSGCPFLDQGMCRIYRFRTFACRAYGIWSQQIGDSRTDDSRRGRKMLLEQWKRLGLELPPEMVEFEIDYCERVECSNHATVTDDGLIEILQNIYNLDSNLPVLQKTFEEAYHSDFSFLITSLIVGFRKALLVKFAVIKEIVKLGSSKRLEDMLEKVTPEALG